MRGSVNFCLCGRGSEKTLCLFIVFTRHVHKHSNGYIRTFPRAVDKCRPGEPPDSHPQTPASFSSLLSLSVSLSCYYLLDAAVFLRFVVLPLAGADSDSVSAPAADRRFANMDF